jgi:hypothetical protein
MLRHHRAIEAPSRCGCSTRRAYFHEVIYSAELMRVGADGEIDIRFTLPREQPEGVAWVRAANRQGAARRRRLAVERKPARLCVGATGFVETAASALVALGHDPARIRTERLGATGSAAR